MPRRMLPVLVALVFVTANRSRAQDTAVTADPVDQVVAVAEAALDAISAGDVVALTDLMVPEAQMFPTSVREGRAGYVVRTRDEQRNSPWSVQVVERGYDAEARVSGTVGMVWMPYDLYVDGEWSHCGADVFTMVRSGSDWLIASMAWSVEQPPDCRAHPDGPPSN